MRITGYTEPSAWVSPNCWGHTVECHHCGHKFKVEVSRYGKCECPKCLSTETAQTMIEEWQKKCAK